ncbi:MAG: hypothetical protein U0271_09285 [Polyangiaceae bacterium]
MTRASVVLVAVLSFGVGSGATLAVHFARAARHSADARDARADEDGDDDDDGARHKSHAKHESSSKATSHASAPPAAASNVTPLPVAVPIGLRPVTEIGNRRLSSLMADDLQKRLFGSGFKVVKRLNLSTAVSWEIVDVKDPGVRGVVRYWRVAPEGITAEGHGTYDTVVARDGRSLLIVQTAAGMDRTKTLAEKLTQ